MLRRPARASGGQNAKPLADPAPDFMRSETLWQFLTSVIWPDGGGKRRPGSLSVFMDDGELKACLSDKDLALVAFVTLDPTQPILEQLNELLEADTLDWRRSKITRSRG